MIEELAKLGYVLLKGARDDGTEAIQKVAKTGEERVIDLHEAHYDLGTYHRVPNVGALNGVDQTEP
jgi:hypothetical protein